MPRGRQQSPARNAQLAKKVTQRVKWYFSWISAAFFAAIAFVGYVGKVWIVPNTYYGDAEYNMALAVNRAVVAPSLSTYVSRPAVEAELDSFFGHPGVDYAVVVGPRGSGKTTLVEACALNRAGVIRVDMERSVDVYSAIVKALGASFAATFTTPDNTLLRRVFSLSATIRDEDWWRPTRFEWARSSQLGGSSSRWVPTIIVEVNAGSADTSGAVARSVKSLNSDGGFTCRVIMVLSDAYAAFAIPGDESRQAFVWIDDFTRNEADEFFDKYAFLPRADAAKLRDKLFDGIGTRPVDLEKARGTLSVANVSEASVDAFVAAARERARKVLRSLFANEGLPSGDEFRGVVRDLLAASDPFAGVPVSRYAGVLATPDVVALALKRYHALLYHFPSDTYRFYSRAYYHAAKALDREAE